MHGFALFFHVQSPTWLWRTFVLHHAGHISGQAIRLRDQTELEFFIEALKKSPLFDQVKLGTVRVGSFGGAIGERFDASFVTIPAPQVAVESSLAGAPEESP